MTIPGVFSKIDTASSLVVTPGVIFCQQGNLQTGWSSQAVCQLFEFSGVTVRGVVTTESLHETHKIANNPSNNMMFVIFMSYLPGERVWSELI